MDIFLFYILYQIRVQNYKKYLILSIIFCTFVIEIIFGMKKRFLCSLLFVILTLTLYSQSMKIMTYNVENLFDTQHDSLKNDKEFLPNSDLRWTNNRFYEKLHEIMQVVVGLGGDELPLLVGLCEVENDFKRNSLGGIRLPALHRGKAVFFPRTCRKDRKPCRNGQRKNLLYNRKLVWALRQG